MTSVQTRNAEALPGDANETYYQLELRVQGSDEVRIDIDFLDYPGGWIVPQEGGPPEREAWAR